MIDRTYFSGRGGLVRKLQRFVFDVADAVGWLYFIPKELKDEGRRNYDRVYGKDSES
jgi:hypothetical protein|tara:strand:- start:223 stop:393 length:171 start_codon:yes stop_codon:yes gene_type:complete